MKTYERLSEGKFTDSDTPRWVVRIPHYVIVTGEVPYLHKKHKDKFHGKRIYTRFGPFPNEKEAVDFVSRHYKPDTICGKYYKNPNRDDDNLWFSM